MTHVRKNIRNAVITALTGNTAAVANVRGPIEQSWDASELPAIEVRTDEESAERLTADKERKREITLEIILTASTTSSVPVVDQLDDLAAEVETILDGGITDAFDYEYAGSSYDGVPEGAEEFASLTMTYDIGVITKLGAPGVSDKN